MSRAVHYGTLQAPRTGALTATPLSPSGAASGSASGQLNANGTGSGTYSESNGDAGSFTLTSKATQASVFVGVYQGTYQITAGPNDGSTGDLALFIENSGSAHQSSQSSTGSQSMSSGTCNLATGAVSLTYIPPTGVTVTGSSSIQLTNNGTNVTSAGTGTFSNGNVSHGTGTKLQGTPFSGSLAHATNAGAAVAAPSILRVSAACAVADTDSLALTFSGALDAESATDVTNYAVTVNGVAATLVSAGYARDVVTLGLDEGAVHSGDKIVVSWNGLLDSRGATLNGHSPPIAAR